MPLVSKTKIDCIGNCLFSLRKHQHFLEKYDWSENLCTTPFCRNCFSPEVIQMKEVTFATNDIVIYEHTFCPNHENQGRKKIIRAPDKLWEGNHGLIPDEFDWAKI